MMKRSVMVWVGFGLFASSCAGSGTRPHDMSVEGHERAAQAMERDARQYNERAEAMASNTDYVDLWALSAGFQSHADDHRAAAGVLQAQEDPKACEGHPRDHVQTCPLDAHRVLDVEPVPQGVRVLFEADVARSFEGHLKCHQAHMALHGNMEEGASCPLESGVQVDVTEDARGLWVTLTSTQTETIETLRSLYVKTSSKDATHSHDSHEEP